MTTIKKDGTVEFKFYRPSATHVRLAGDFSGWLARAIEMQTNGDGWWSAKMELPVGEYRFRYVADDRWYTDFASHGIETCEQGWNSVLLIPGMENAALNETHKTMVKSAA